LYGSTRSIHLVVPLLGRAELRAFDGQGDTQSVFRYVRVDKGISLNPLDSLR